MFAYPASLNIYLRTGLTNWERRERQKGVRGGLQTTVFNPIFIQVILSLSLQISRSDHKKSKLNYVIQKNRKTLLVYSPLMVV